MIDFDEIVNKFGEPGTLLDLASEVCIVEEMHVERDAANNTDRLVARVLFPRNIGRSADVLIFDQAQAEQFLLSEWKLADPAEVGRAVLAAHKRLF